MSWRTTLVLFIVLVALGAYAYYDSQQEPVVLEPTPLVAGPTPERATLLGGVTIEQVQELSITAAEDDQQAVFTLVDGVWMQMVPTQTVVVSTTLNTAAGGLLELTSRRTFEPPETDEAEPLAAYGLDEPAYEVELTYLVEDEPESLRLAVGSQTPQENGYYVLAEGDERVHVISLFVIDNLIDLLETPPIPTPTPDLSAVLTGTMTVTGTETITGTVEP